MYYSLWVFKGCKRHESVQSFTRRLKGNKRSSAEETRSPAVPAALLGLFRSCPFCLQWEAASAPTSSHGLQHPEDASSRSWGKFFFFFFGSFFRTLGTEPRALRFLGKRSTTELNPQPRKFYLEHANSACFLIWKHLYVGLGTRDLAFK